MIFGRQKMNKNEKYALRVLGQREMLYKMQSLIAKRFMKYAYPMRQVELTRFVEDLCKDLLILDNKFSVQSNLSQSDLLEYKLFDSLFEQFNVKCAKSETALQVRFDFGELVDE